MFYQFLNTWFISLLALLKIELKAVYFFALHFLISLFSVLY